MSSTPLNFVCAVLVLWQAMARASGWTQPLFTPRWGRLPPHHTHPWLGVGDHASTLSLPHPVLSLQPNGNGSAYNGMQIMNRMYADVGGVFGDYNFGELGGAVDADGNMYVARSSLWSLSHGASVVTYGASAARLAKHRDRGVMHPLYPYGNSHQGWSVCGDSAYGSTIMQLHDVAHPVHMLCAAESIARVTGINSVMPGMLWGAGPAYGTEFLGTSLIPV